MTENLALLRGVLEQPFEDGPRLVYADWFEENNQEKRAAFIRWGFQKNCGHFPGFAYRRWGFPWWEGKSHWSRVWRQSPCVNLGLSRPATEPRPAQHCYVAMGWVAGIYLPLDVFMQKAKGIFASQPVVFTNLFGREPFGDNAVGFQWFHQPIRPFQGAAHNLPAPLIDILAGRRFPTRQEAIDHLGWAATTYGRRLHGLPDLPPPEPPKFHQVGSYTLLPLANPER